MRHRFGRGGRLEAEIGRMKIDPSIAMAFIGMSCGSGWIVEQHGGTVALESVLGELTRAVTRLPLA